MDTVAIEHCKNIIFEIFTKSGKKSHPDSEIKKSHDYRFYGFIGKKEQRKKIN